MNSRGSFGVCLAIATAWAWSGEASGSVQWKPFTSDAGFSVNYPARWHRLADKHVLEALSPGQQQEGVVIGRDQAELRVERLPPGQSINHALRRWAKGERVFERNSSTRVPADCRKITVRDDEGPGRADETFALFCQIEAQTFRVTIRYWADDPAWRAHRSVAASAASSIRLKDR
jgi:hypothetical protein